MDIKKTYPLVIKDVAQLCDNDKPTALGAVLDQHPSLVNLNDENGRTLLHYAAEAGSFGCVSVLLSRGADIEAKDILGETPLHRALARSRRIAAHVLLDAGANPNSTNAFGTTPTMYAALAGPDHFQVLVDRGGDVSLRDKLGRGIKEWAEQGKWLFEQEGQARQLRP